MAVLALACHLGAASMTFGASAQDSDAARLEAVSVLCQASHPGREHQPAAPHHFADPAIANAAHGFGAAVALVAAPGAAPAPCARVIGQVALPGARAPPGRFAAATSARGPPNLI